MALKQLILARKIDERSKKLTEYLEERSKLEKREGELSTALSEAEAPEEVEEVEKSADELEKEIKDLDEQIKNLEDEKAGLEKELEEIPGTDDSEESEDGGEKRSMKNKNITTREGGEKLEQTRSAINAFRITPACAGNTYHHLVISVKSQDHPRMCG